MNAHAVRVRVAETRSRPPGRAPTGLDAPRCDPAREEEWRPALVAFYQSEINHARANRISGGDAFDYMDRWTIKSLKAALSRAPA